MKQTNKKKRPQAEDDGPIRPYRSNGRKAKLSSSPPEEADAPDPEGGEEEAPAEPRLSDQSAGKLKKKLILYTEEFQLIASDPSPAALTRRVQLTRLMRGIQDVLDAREPLVEVRVPPSVTGEPFVIGELQFNPGVHHVRSGVAVYLLWLIDQNQRVEMNRLKQNGRNIDLGTIGSRARMAQIARDTGDSDWSGRGTAW